MAVHAQIRLHPWPYARLLFHVTSDRVPIRIRFHAARRLDGDARLRLPFPVHRRLDGGHGVRTLAERRARGYQCSGEGFRARKVVRAVYEGPRVRGCDGEAACVADWYVVEGAEAEDAGRVGEAGCVGRIAWVEHGGSDEGVGDEHAGGGGVVGGGEGGY
jgi:hypothetical protein